MKKSFITIIIISIVILVSLYFISYLSGTERVSYYPINCSKLVDGCYIDWLSEYYEIPLRTPSDYDEETNFSSISFQKNTEFIKDYFQKEGIIVSDVQYMGPVLKKSVENSGGWGDYDLIVIVPKSDSEKMLQFGFSGMIKPN